MKKFCLLCILLILNGSLALGSETAPTDSLDTPEDNAKAALSSLVSSIKSRIDRVPKPRRSIEDFEAAFQAFDALALEYENADKEAVAMILFMKGTLYYQGFGEYDLAVETLQQLRDRFPNTERSKSALEAIHLIEAQANANAIRDHLVPGAPFPPLSSITLAGDPLPWDEYSGQVVLVLFWSFTCDTCLDQLPSYLALYDEYRERGFTVVGVSVNEDRKGLSAFVAERAIPWRQVFDGRGWKSDNIRRYGVKTIPESYLIDEAGEIIARNLQMEQLRSFLGGYLSTGESKL